MTEKSTTTSKLAASVLIIFNLLTMTTSLLCFTFGLWVIASPTTLSAVIDDIGITTLKVLLPQTVLTVQVGIGITGVATFIFFVSFLGFYGALSRSSFLLFMYSTLVLLLLLLECALVYYFTTNLAEKGLQEQDGQWTHALRLAFQCCEHNSSVAKEIKLPWSCCNYSAYPDNCTVTRIYTKDCNKTITTWISHYQTGIYASLTVLHLILSSCSIIRRRSMSRSYS